MKYMIMMFGDPASTMADTSPQAIQGMQQLMMDLDAELRDNGEHVDGQGLGDPSQATTVRFADGLPVATEGPFAEAKESLAGYWIVDVPEEARAVEIASRVVAHTRGVMEVRRVMDHAAEV